MKVKDLLKENVYLDVTTNISDYGMVAYCGGIILTNEAKNTYKEILNKEYVIKNGFCIVQCKNYDEHKKVIDFFTKLASFCTVEEFKRIIKKEL